MSGLRSVWPFGARSSRPAGARPRTRPIEIGAGAYATSLEHVLDELRLIDLWVHAEVARVRSRPGPARPAHSGLSLIVDEEVDRNILAAPLDLGDGKTADLSRYFQTYLRLRERVDARIAATPPGELRLPRLQAAFRLTNGEVVALLLALAADWDPKYRRTYAYLQDDATRVSPTVGLLAEMAFANPARASRSSADAVAGAVLDGYRALAPGGALRRHALIESREALTSIAEEEVGVAPRVARYLASSQPPGVPDDVDPDLAQFTRLQHSTLAWEDLVVPATLLERLRRLPHVLRAPADSPSVTIAATVALAGPRGAGQLEAAIATASELGVNLLVVEGRRAAERLDTGSTSRLLREGVLQEAALYLRGLELGEESTPGATAHLSTLRALAGFAGLLFVEAERFPARHGEVAEPDHFFLFPIPSYRLRVRLWGRALAAVAPAPAEAVAAVDGPTVGDAVTDRPRREPSPELEAVSPALRPAVLELANGFTLTGGQIQEAVAVADQHAKLARGVSGLTRDDLWYGANRLAGQRLVHFARKLTPRHTWTQLILPASSKRHLVELSDRIRYRSRVFADADFQSRVSLGRGLLVLFTGPSGTGKTMAAEVVAGDLGMDLYKVDLSAVVSKYIGETEKNLARIFEDAGSGNSILFFDEADALFGKRSEVKDAHDRYANIEVNYLLQRIEEYDGVVILASNLRQNMDEAFLRRLNIIVEFPFPSAEARAQIWRGMFPPGVALGPEINLDEVSARFRLTGGSIRNAAVDAAFRAVASQDGASREGAVEPDGGAPATRLTVTRELLILAVGREYQKLGRPITKGEFGIDDYRLLSDYLYAGQEG